MKLTSASSEVAFLFLDIFFCKAVARTVEPLINSGVSELTGDVGLDVCLSFSHGFGVTVEKNVKSVQSHLQD